MSILANYIYTAVDNTGKKLKNSIEASNKDAVMSLLKSRGIYVISVDEETIFNKELAIGSNGEVSAKQIAIFAKQFSMLLKAGISISESLDILKDQLEDRKMAKIVDDIAHEVQKGSSLSTAMRNTEKLPSLFVNTIEAGEGGGFLDEVMVRMTEYYEKTTKLASKVKSALIYPALVLLVTICVCYILITRVVPEFAEMFASMDLELPFLTRLLMAVGDFFNAWWFLLFALLVAGIIGLVYYVRTPAGRYNKDSLLLKIPLIKSLVLKSVVSRFARTLGILLKTGVPMINAIEYSVAVLNNAVIERAMQTVKSDVASGTNLSNPIQKMGMFPRLVTSMVKIGEETGALDEKYFKTVKNIALVVMLVDIRHKPTRDDITMYNFLINSNLNFIIVPTKADKVPVTKIPEYCEVIKTELNAPDDIDIIPVSAEKKQNLDLIWQAISETLLAEEN